MLNSCVVYKHNLSSDITFYPLKKLFHKKISGMKKHRQAADKKNQVLQIL